MKKKYLMAYGMLFTGVIGAGLYFTQSKPELKVLQGQQLKYNSIYVQEVGGLSFSRGVKSENDYLASIHKVFIAGEFVKNFGPNSPSAIKEYAQYSNLEVAQSMLVHKDNLIAEQMVEAIGFDKFQDGVRKASGNSKIELGNGSGCPGAATGPHSCNDTGLNKAYSEEDIAKYLAGLTKFIQTNNLEMSKLFMPLVDMDKYQFINTQNLKPFGIESGMKDQESQIVYPLAGVITSTTSNKSYSFVMSGKGDSRDVFKEQMDILKTLNDN